MQIYILLWIIKYFSAPDRKYGFCFLHSWRNRFEGIALRKTLLWHSVWWKDYRWIWKPFCFQKFFGYTTFASHCNQETEKDPNNRLIEPLKKSFDIIFEGENMFSNTNFLIHPSNQSKTRKKSCKHFSPAPFFGFVRGLTFIVYFESWKTRKQWCSGFFWKDFLKLIKSVFFLIKTTFLWVPLVDQTTQPRVITQITSSQSTLKLYRVNLRAGPILLIKTTLVAGFVIWSFVGSMDHCQAHTQSKVSIRALKKVGPVLRQWEMRTFLLLLIELSDKVRLQPDFSTAGSGVHYPSFLLCHLRWNSCWIWYFFVTLRCLLLPSFEKISLFGGKELPTCLNLFNFLPCLAFHLSTGGDVCGNWENVWTPEMSTSAAFDRKWLCKVKKEKFWKRSGLKIVKNV